MPYLMTPRGVAWHYETAGQGEPLIFIHGWAADQRIWGQQVEFFCKTHQVVSLDLPGHGQSGWSEMSLKDIAEELNFLLQGLKVDEVNLVASSLGGLVALKYFELFPAQVRRFVFVGSLPRFAKSKEHPFGLEVPRIRKLKSQVQEDFPEILNIFFRSLFTVEERESLRFQWLQTFQKSADLPDPQALEKYLRMLEKEDLTPLLPEVRVPALLVSGSEDYICSPESLRNFHAQLSGAQMQLFSDCGHFPFLSRPEEFNVIVRQFLTDDTS